MLFYKQTCLECGELQRRIRIQPGQDILLFEKEIDKCEDCGSDHLKLELINKSFYF